MHVLLTGATGFVGRHVVLAFLREGYRLTLYVRNPTSAREFYGASVEYFAANQSDEALIALLDQTDAVVHLAGATVFRPWTAKYRQEMVQSRVGLARRLVDAMGRAKPRQRVMVTASGIGGYGSGGSRWLDEHEPIASGFLAELTRDWEAATWQAQSHGARTVALRFGLVLGREGGFLGKMLPATAAGLAATFGDGSAYVSWIHIRDLSALIIFCLTHDQAQGVINAVAPHPEPQAVVLDHLAQRLHTKVRLRLPLWPFRLLGEQGTMLIDSQRITPSRALSLGFPFAFPDLASALDDIIDDTTALSFRTIDDKTNAPAQTHVLAVQRLHLNAPPTDVFAFFCNPHNLSVLTPPFAAFTHERMPEKLEQGATFCHRLRILGIPWRWNSTITVWQPPHVFQDVQTSGPFAAWQHNHSFTSQADGTTLVVDTIHYGVGLGGITLGPLSMWIDRWLVRPRLARIFAYRAQCLKVRFAGDVPPLAAAAVDGP